MSNDIRTEILSALADDKRFPPMSTDYEALAPYVPDALLRAVDDRLDETFTIKGYLEIGAAFLRIMTENGFLDNFMPKEAASLFEAFINLADEAEQNAQDVEGCLRELGLTDVRALELSDPPFSDDMIDVYASGELTFRRLIMTQPGVFIPM